MWPPAGPGGALQRAELPDPRWPPTSAQERGRHPGVDGDVQPSGVGQVPAGEGEDGGGDVLGEHLALEEGPLGVELAQLVLGYAVHGGALGAPPAGEDAGPAYDAVGVDAVDADAVLAQLGGEQPYLVRLVGLCRAVGDVVRPGEHRVLGGDVDDVAAHP